MAGPNSETSALWQVQASAADGTQSTATNTNTIWFNPSDPQTSDTQSIIDFDIDFRRAVPENEAVDADNNELQDMGIGGLDLTLVVKIKNANNDDAGTAVNKLSTWLQEGNSATGFTKGRFGLTLAALPQFDVTPTSTLGYHLRRVHFKKPEDVDTIIATIDLALGGDITTAI